MDQFKEKLPCRNCGELSVRKVKFPYPSKVMINPADHKIKLAAGPLQTITFILWIILFLIFSLSYALGLDTPKSIFLSSAVILITAALISIAIIRLRGTVPADVYQCNNCNTIWLLKDKEDWEKAAEASGKFLKNFENPRRYIDTKNEKTWECPNCGVKVPENYEICWKCRTSRKFEF